MKLFILRFPLFYLSLGIYLAFNREWISQLNAQEEDQYQMKNQTLWQWNTPSHVPYSIHYIEKGSGSKHILLIHGFAAHSYTWKFLTDDLVDAGYHVWSLDLLGFGLSDKPRNISYGLDLFIAQIEAFMDAMHIPSASFIGHSMGGGLSLAMAAFHPTRVQSLILIDALAYPIKLPFYFLLPKILGNLTKPFFGRMMVKQVLRDVMYDHKKITEEQINAYEFPLHMPGGKDAFIKTLQSFDHKEFAKLESFFKTIKAPVLLIWGEQDKWMPYHYYQRISQALPHAHRVLIPLCGHAPQEECPLQVNDTILKFYKEIPH